MSLHVTKSQCGLLCGMMMLQAAAVRGQAPAVEPAQDTPPGSAEQRIYRGVVGNLLETVPLEPAQRVQLQRANAVVSNPMTARTVALALGLANPPLMIIGLIWGLWSASNIKPIRQPAEQREPAPIQEARVVVDDAAPAPVPASEPLACQNC